jgi:hypothetical protein
MALAPIPAKTTTAKATTAKSVFVVHIIENSKISRSPEFDNITIAREFAVAASGVANEARIFENGVLVEVFRAGKRS